MTKFRMTIYFFMSLILSGAMVAAENFVNMQSQTPSQLPIGITQQNSQNQEATINDPWYTIDTVSVNPETIRFNWLKRSNEIKETYFDYDEINTILDHIVSDEALFDKKIEIMEGEYARSIEGINNLLNTFNPKIKNIDDLTSFIDDLVKQTNTLIRNEHVQKNIIFKKELTGLKNPLKNLSIRAQDLKNNIALSKKIRQQLFTARDMLKGNIESMKLIEKTSWDEYQKFDELITDKQASVISATIKNNLENIKQFENFLKKKLLPFFTNNTQNMQVAFGAIIERVNTFIQESQNITTQLLSAEKRINDEIIALEIIKQQEEKNELEMLRKRVEEEKKKALSHRPWYKKIYVQIVEWINSFEKIHIIVKWIIEKTKFIAQITNNTILTIFKSKKDSTSPQPTKEPLNEKKKELAVTSPETSKSSSPTIPPTKPPTEIAQAQATVLNQVQMELTPSNITPQQIVSQDLQLPNPITDPPIFEQKIIVQKNTVDNTSDAENKVKPTIEAAPIQNQQPQEVDIPYQQQGEQQIDSSEILTQNSSYTENQSNVPSSIEESQPFTQEFTYNKDNEPNMNESDKLKDLVPDENTLTDQMNQNDNYNTSTSQQTVQQKHKKKVVPLGGR